MEVVEQHVQRMTIQKKLKKEQRTLLFHRIRSNKLVVTGFTIFILITLLAIAGPFLVSYDPYEMDAKSRLIAPNTDHLLGTDNIGRDLLSRIVYGAQISISVGFSVTIIATILGVIIGLYASYYRVLDNFLMRICDGLMAFPPILLAISLMAALGPSVLNVIISLSIVYTPNIARIVRSTALVIREETYIEAMKVLGASSFRIIWQHIAPNTLSPVIVQATFTFATAIIVEAALSFLGAGVPAPHPSWGNILYDGKLVIFSSWWMVVFPGLCIVSVVLGLNLLGDGFRDLVDPHTKSTKK
ncbi:ABC transporter permease [Brevibacillus sp. NRS-1366]|uniref:ABC transporter permease n=1 Tax=Brevibacillus sp. NRS-1366 TaxID=3233899 RepID=UPI003D1F5C2A